MKHILLLLLIAATSAAATAPAPNPAATIKQDVQSYANALLAGNYEVVVAYTHKRIVEMMGGKEVAIAKWKGGMPPPGPDGYGYTEITMGTPSAPRKIGPWLTATVPQHMVAKVPGSRMIQDSVLLGISEDLGKSWVFFDLSSFFIAKEQLAKVFPELDGQIQIPEKKLVILKE